MSMKNLTMRSSVTVTGPPSRICLRNKGITEPLEPSTLPKRVVTNWVQVTTPGLPANCSFAFWLTFLLSDWT